MEKQYKEYSIDNLNSLAEKPFVHISYTEAVKELKNAKEKFEFPVEWGLDLQSEHERYLTDKVFKGPVIVTDYPKEIKAFYMRLNPDEKTVAAMDVLGPEDRRDHRRKPARRKAGSTEERMRQQVCRLKTWNGISISAGSVQLLMQGSDLDSRGWCSILPAWPISATSYPAPERHRQSGYKRTKLPSEDYFCL